MKRSLWLSVTRLRARGEPARRLRPSPVRRPARLPPRRAARCAEHVGDGRRLHAIRRSRTARSRGRSSTPPRSSSTTIPDKPAPLGWQDPARGRGRLPGRLEGRQDLHDHRQAGLQVQRRRGRDRRELRVRDQPRAEPGDAVAGGAVHRRHRRRAGRPRRQGARPPRASRSRATSSIIKLTQPDGGLLAKLGMPFFQALPTNLPTRPARRQRLPVGRPVLHRRAATSAGTIIAQAEPVLQGHAPGERRHVRHHGEHEPRPEPAPGQDGSRSTTTWAACRRRRTPTSAQQFGINKTAATSSTRSSRPTTSPSTRRRPPFGNVEPAQGRQLRDRPPGDAPPVRGAFAGKRTDQILPPGMGGFRDSKIVPARRARTTRRRRRSPAATAATVSLWTANVGRPARRSARSLQFNLTQMGCNVERQAVPGLPDLRRRRHEGRADFDAALAGWNQDYPDPFDFIDVLLNGNNIHDDEQQQPRVLQRRRRSTSKMDAANKLDRRRALQGVRRRSTSRSRASTRRGLSYDNRNEREFVSAQVGGFVFQPANASADLNTLFIK